MRFSTICVNAFMLFALSSSANATTFTFDTDPFAGTPVLTAPGRQIVGGEQFINFSTAHDQFDFDSTAFGIQGPVEFVNATTSGIPSSDVNVVVLETFDNDNNPLTPFGAGNAADLIASRVTTHGAGFFVYFNQSLNIPRLVYSTDLASNTADLKILARMINLFGDEGKNTMPTFTASNFEITTSSTPEPSTTFLMTAALAMFACSYLLRRKRNRVSSNH